MRYLKDFLERFLEINGRGHKAACERPPDCAAVGASDVLAEVVQEDSVSAEEKEDEQKDSIP